mmetsp:Transcript_40648/g.128791  ORF Transcript_40648/g.128791 Transcript_40648/m.128791 type:complete len:414 (-) Transcript_40648:105-1346(-)
MASLWRLGCCCCLVVSMGLVSAFLFALLAAIGRRSGGSPEQIDTKVMGFVAEQRLKAVEAFELLYGDGSGADGEAPPKMDAFIEKYLTEALFREAKAMRKAKGYDKEEEEAKHVGLLDRESLSKVEKKDAPSTMEGEIERLVVQKRQKRAVRERVREGKTVEVLDVDVKPQDRSLTSWRLGCAESLYREHVYDSIPGCSPGPPSGPPCGRFVIDGVAAESEQKAMVAAIDEAFVELFHQGAETLLVPDAAVRARMGEEGYRLTEALLERVRSAVAAAANVSTDALFYSGSLLKRMDWPPLKDEWQLDERHDSFNAHVDKANIASYDWSALLYLNSVGEEFGGGELLFHDSDADRSVRPIGGRVVAFSSGLENLHRVMPMQWGRRYVLSMWFTCSARHRHENLIVGSSRPQEEL